LKLFKYKFLSGLMFVSAAASAGPPVPDPFFLYEFPDTPWPISTSGPYLSMSNDGLWVAFLCGTTDSRALCIGNTETLVVDEILTMPMGETVFGVEISGDGMVVTYSHTDTTPRQVWAYDQNTMTHEMVSVNGDEDPGDEDSREGKPNGSGRFVVFNSLAGNLVEDDTNSWDVFVRDRLTQTTTRVSLAFNGEEGDAPSGRDGPPSISADGNLIAFNSEAENLVQGDIDDDDPPYEFDNEDSFFVDIPGDSILRMSEVTDSFQGGDGNSHCSGLSGDGNYGVFITRARNLFPGPWPAIPGEFHALLRWNRASGGFQHVNPPAFGDQQFDQPLWNGCSFDLSFDGSLVYFTGLADNYANGDNNSFFDVFAWQGGNVTMLRPVIDEMEYYGIAVSTNGLGDNIAMLAVNESETRVGIVIMARGDITPPTIINLGLTPQGAVVQGAIVDVEGIASDFNLGGSDIVGAEFSVDGGGWVPFTAVDGAFDSELEEIRGFVDSGPLSFATHSICARSQDAAGLYSEEQCLDLEVVAGPMDGDFMVQCRHQPLWPQPGETVTISMGTRGPTLVELANEPWIPVDRTEIWFDDPDSPVVVNDTFGTTTNNYTSEVLAAGSFTYGCRGVLGGTAIFSGWREVAVGDPGPGEPIPVGFTGPSSERLDMVFIADEASYTTPDNPDFLTDVEEVIFEAFNRYGMYNKFGHLFNFWLARNTGVAERIVDGMGNTISKTITAPVDWDENYGFSNSGVILHTNEFRDFATDSFFSSEPFSIGTIRHEAGHRPFGLADEYVMPADGGYVEAEEFPNVYESEAACEIDAPNLGRDPAFCREFISSNDDTIGETFYSSEPTPNDLMNRDRSPPQAADIRRIEWYFEKCGIEEC